MNSVTRGPKLRLLLIEDSPGDARLLREYLNDADNFRFELTHVDRLADALTAIESAEYDLLFLDLSLPDSQGLQSLTRLHKLAPDVPIIVLTGLNDEFTAIDAVRQGAQDYLVKNQLETNILVRSVRYSIERYRILEALRESEERYALAALAANDGLWDWNLLTDEVYYSPRWRLMLGFEEVASHGSPDEWFARIHQDDVERARCTIRDHLEGRTPQFECEYRIRHEDGVYRWMLSRGMALRDPHGIPYRLAGSQTDISARKRTEEKLIHDALHDPLTQLPNRNLFRHRLEVALRDHQRDQNTTFAVMFLDLDRFKMINDSLGHLIGDELLKAIANRLQELMEPDDIIARLGGDEFAILLHGIQSPLDAEKVARRILRSMRKPFRVSSHDVFSTGCIGIAVGNDEYTRPEEMLRDADTAMYRAKSSGMAKYQIFDSTMHKKAVALWKLETDLRHAIERNEFRIHYQPIVSLHTERLAGFEALVRWQHPERGLLYPIDFLPLAEETGMIARIDRLTIREGARQLKVWQAMMPSDQPIFMNVNLSASVLNQPDLARFLAQILQETGIPPASLKLEITESVVMSDVINLPRTLLELQALNLQLCLDDFGTGYSSLSSLHAYPVDILKIDSSFIHGMAHEDGNSDIVRTIITLAHDLDLQVIAEGIECPTQVMQLQTLKCEYGQGTLFSQAVDAEQIGQLIKPSQQLINPEPVLAPFRSQVLTPG